MSVRKNFLAVLITSIIFSCTELFAYTFFTGNAGLDLQYKADESASDYDPNLEISANFAGQFNFTSDFWGHLEFTLKTEDLISSDLFKKTGAEFNLEEISFVKRLNFTGASNYFGAFAGYFEPSGSDIFIRRYFGSESINSNMTKSWIGRKSSTLYSHYGIGLSDVIKFYNAPLATAFYLYFNNENESSYYANTDLRLAGVFNYCTFDVNLGVGFPPKSGGGAALVVEDLYLHGGLSLLLGNNYTRSLFLQAGISDVKAKLGDSVTVDFSDLYALLESRHIFNTVHVNYALYNIPDEKIEDMTFLYDPIGFNLNVYCDSIPIGSKTFTGGVCTTVSLPGKDLTDVISSPSTLVTSVNDIDVYIIPYFSTTFLSGEISAQINTNVMGFWQDKWYKAISCNVGYEVLF